MHSKPPPVLWLLLDMVLQAWQNTIAKQSSDAMGVSREVVCNGTVGLSSLIVFE